VIKNRCSHVSLILFIAVAVFLICPLSARADTPPGTVGVTGGCVGNVGGLNNPSCTANDVKLTSIDPATVVINGPSCDSVPDHCVGVSYVCQGGTTPGAACTSTHFCPGAGATCDAKSCTVDADCGTGGKCVDTIEFSATGVFTSGSAQRYDIGLYIAIDGDSAPPGKTAGDGAKFGQCTRFAFSNAQTNKNLDSDQCGDLQISANTSIPFGPVRIQCVDINPKDGLVDIYHCETWGNNDKEVPAINQNCVETEDVEAGTGAKCFCGILAGACIAAPDGNACTTDVCLGTCSVSGAACANNTECPSGQTCTGIHLQHIDNSARCNDNNACTTDTCDANNGCVNTPISCSDSNACTTDTCDANNGCVHTAISCDDSNACTTDTCDTNNGCVHTAISCNDSNACTTDTCDANNGCVHTPISCNDSNACTADTCDVNNGCVHTAVNCNDGNACTTDTCDANNGCVHTPVSCNDGNACTTDTCDANNGCVHTAVSCDDSNACTTDTCDANNGCAHTAISCDDSNACTTDTCNATNGCQHADNGSCGGAQIAPTATTCSDFAGSTAADLNFIDYGVKTTGPNTKINNVSPGVLFYYTHLTGVSSGDLIEVKQTETLVSGTPVTPLFGVQHGQVVLYNADCSKSAATTNPSLDGGGVVSFNMTASGDFILGIKYDPGTVVGTTVGSPKPVVRYDFVTDVNGTQVETDPNGLTLRPKP